MSRNLDRTLFTGMVREEWRLHAELFGGRRFAAFPVLIAVLAGAAVVALTETGTSVDATIAGLHALVFAFGLHTGTIGLVGRDAMDNLVGEINLLVFSARTLPVSRRRLLLHFLLKDALYYSILFVLPASLAFLPAALSGQLGFAQVPVLWGSLSATFVLGLVVTLALLGLSSRGVAGWLVAGVLAVGAGAVHVAGADWIGATPYALFASPSPVAAVGTAGAVGFAALIGVVAFEPSTSRATRTVDPAFERWRARLGDERGLTTKTFLDVARSDGGLWKVPFSGGVIFGVCVGLVELAGRITGVEPSTGATFGALLGLSAFTTYNWVTQYDDAESYLQYPLAVEELFVAKRRVAALVGLPTAIGYFLIAALLFDARLVDAVAGLALLVGFHQYLLGLTTFLAGFDPAEFLFDTVLFAVFTVAVAATLVPALVVGLVLAPLSSTALAALAGGGVLMLATGELAYRRAIGRWIGRIGG
ncbi:hypothetical protein SAMN06269185_0637 [Natronoarchaeum philippinense]|uniref:ABC-2 type transport system permease protein n=1 Tax=Natronoarchaeum philippinense TaxID=558529 RepID=A0A285N5B5_NATPI|nr:hypothetical protein [Natronoarchaeum philippinense]SNZ04664.1 hypothetical protein SAMN06269185_0637 [Natronoarchaeum philippinense]